MRLGVIIQCVVVQHQLYCILEDLAHISIKQEAKKNSGSDSDGGAKTHLYRTAKFTRVFQTGKFGCFYFLCLVKHS